MSDKYCTYFDIDEEYFPRINDYSIAAAGPDFWMRTYPHQTFIGMLETMERILSRQEKHSLWIEGAYGTGKSQCAYALKKILEVPEKELRTYWDKYDPLRKKSDLLEKLIGHKKSGIVTAHRYASGGIDSPRALFLAVQESVSAALKERNLYAGENTLKESVIAWIDEPSHKLFLDALLKKPEWAALFSQSTADEVLNALRKGGEVKNLMDHLFCLADKEGITALNIDADRLVSWLTDVIDRNHVKIVLIWDEFSDYFKKNRDSLSEFQKLVELVDLKPFYFIVVTHESGQLITTADKTWEKVKDRFVFVTISLPDNIAFELIGHAFNVKQPATDDWDVIAGDLNSRVHSAREAVMKAAKITDPKVMKNIMPLHPMAAFLLKNIASAFQSNQRSMFDFIKSPNTKNGKAFQWYIENMGPLDERPLLTVDLLWDFFYEKGRENLTPDIRLILDIYPQQQDLRRDEEAVLKTILIMQAIDQRLGGAIDLFKATGQNLSYAFEGIPDLEGSACVHIASRLVEKGILVSNPISGGRHVFVAAILAGDQAKIDGYKKKIRETSTTLSLVTDAELSTVLSLPPALRLRFETETNTGKLSTVTAGDFARTINRLRDNKPAAWCFQAVIAFAKDENEAADFRETIRKAATEKQYKNIVFIDALSTPLGREAFEQYVEYSAMAMYYSGNHNSSSKENRGKAKHILDQDWKSRIYNGPFIVYTYRNQEGEKFGNAQGAASILQAIVLKRFPDVFDFNRKLNENQLKITSAKSCARSGIELHTSGVVSGIEKYILPDVWNVDQYWKDPSKAALPISKIKLDIDHLIDAAFCRDGQISIADLCDHLEGKYGFAPCNLSAFLTGFLLKEYGREPFRCSDSSGSNESMTQEKLAEMIGNYIKKTSGKIKPTYIVKMTSEEMSFYDITKTAWHIEPSLCSSVEQVSVAIKAKMRDLGFPLWCLAEVDENGIYPIAQKYIDLVRKEGSEAHKIANEIGRIAAERARLPEELGDLLTTEKCQQGMMILLQSFEAGRILSLADEIGARENVLSDIRSLFVVKYSCLWDREMGENEIRKLLIYYGFVKQSNAILNTSAHSKSDALKKWQEQIRFTYVSYEYLEEKYPSLKIVWSVLLRMYQKRDLPFEQIETFLTEITEYESEIYDLIRNEVDIFREAYALYLENLNEMDIGVVKSKLPTGMFELSRTKCNARVRKEVEEYRKAQLKTQLSELWQKKTNTKNPREWSSHYRTSILCCVSEKDFSKAKKAFDTLNRNISTDSEISDALLFLQTTDLFETLDDENKRNASFERGILGKYHSLLPDLDKVRDALGYLSVEPYEWYECPNVKNKVKQLAEAEYNAGGSDHALSKIEKMDDTQLKEYLKRLVMENVDVGIEILTNGED